MALRSVGVRLTADISQYTSALARAGAATKDFTGKLDQSAKAGKLDKVADTAGVAGIALAGMAGYAIKANADFSKAMSGVQAATHASAKDIGALRTAALQAGKDTQYSATQAAQGITELSKAGVSTADVLGGGLKGALALAAAGQLSVADASETAATTMTQFGLAGKDIPHVADVLAAAAGKAQGSVSDMSVALKYAGLPAHTLGISLEETAGTLALFAKNGLIGEQAGTGFRGVLASLEGPSAKAADTMQELGIEVYGANGKFVGMTGVAEQLRTKLGGLSEAQRNAALTTIFGRENLQAAIILMNGGQKAVQDWTKGVNDQGYATKTASDLTNNLSGDLERLKGSLETLAIESGSGANGGLRVLVKSLDGLVGQFSKMPSVVGSGLTILAAVGGASLIALAAFIKLRKGLAEAVTQLNAMGPAGEKAAVGLQKTAGMAGKAVVAFAALEAASAFFDSIDNKSANVDRLTSSLTNLANTGNSSGELNDMFGKNFDDLGRIAMFAESAKDGYGKFVNGVANSIPIFGQAGKSLGNFGSRLIAGTDFNQATEQMGALDTALTNYMTTTNDAKKASELWNQVLSKSGLDSQQLADLLPNAYKEVGALNQAQMDGAKAGKAQGAGAKAAADGVNQVAGATPPATDATKKYTTAAQAAAGAAKGQRIALGQLSDFMKAETDPVFGLIKAEGELKSAQDKATKAIKEHGRNSKEAKAATQDFALAAIGLQGAVGNVSGSFNGKLSPALVNTLKKAGASKAEIKNLEQQFKDAKKAADKYDGNYAAKASAPGAKDAKKQLDEAYTAANHFDGPYRANASAPGATNARKQLNDAYTAANHFAGPYRANVSVTGYSTAAGLLNRLSVYQQALKSGKIPAGFNGPIKGPDGKFYADGGPVGGWSPHKRADNIPAWLTANEWVHPVDSVKYYGPQLMSAIQHRQVPREVLAGFATGRLGKMGDLPLGLAGGGPVLWPFRTTAAHTRIPSRAEVESKVGGQAGPFLHAQDGKPYVWASAGPGGYDCSGIVSAVYNLLHGRSPYHHTFSTASLPGGWFTKPGIGGQLTAAWSNPGEAPASSTTGHMMGMAGGLTFESTGSRGVHLGRTTRRLTDFAHIAHYGLGGKVGGVPVFDSGGTLMPGYNTVYNATGRPEPVSPMWQNAGSGGSGATVNVTFSGPVGNQLQLETWMSATIDNLRRKGKI